MFYLYIYDFTVCVYLGIFFTIKLSVLEKTQLNLEKIHSLCSVFQLLFNMKRIL